MNQFITSVAEELTKGSRDEIQSQFNARLLHAREDMFPSFESTGTASLLSRFAKDINLAKRGNYTPVILDKFKIQESWLVTKEIVVELPLTGQHTTLPTVFGHILKSKAVIESVETNLEWFISQLAGYLNSPEQLNCISGVKSLFTDRKVAIHGVGALERMVDITRPSRTKLERLFNSVSDMNVAIGLSNEVNQMFGGVDLNNIDSQVERIVELMEALTRDAPHASRACVTVLTDDIAKLGLMISDLAVLIQTTSALTESLSIIQESF